MAHKQGGRLLSHERLAAVPGYGLLRRFGARFLTDDTVLLSSALAFQFFLALFPFAILVAAFSGALVRHLGLPDVMQLLYRLLDQLPPAADAALRAELQQIISRDTPRILSITLAGMLWAATVGTNSLLLAMDRTYGVPAARRGLRRTLVAGGLTLLAGWSLVAGGLLVGVLLTLEQILVDLLGAAEETALPDGVTLWACLVALAFVVAAGVYRLAPNLAQPWRRVLPGAAVFAAAWLVMTVGFAIFVTYFSTLGLTYGALAGVVAVLMWLYWTAFLLLAGAVLNAVLGENPAGSAPQKDLPALRPPAAPTRPPAP